MKKITILICLFGAATLSAQVTTPANWSHSLSKKVVRQGDTLELIFSVQLDKNWHLYNNVQDYEIGPFPSTFNFESHKSYKLLGSVVGIDYIKSYEPTFKVNVRYFEHSAEFRQRINILAKNSLIKGNYEYQVCNTIDGKCIIGIDDFEFQIQTIN